MPETEKGGGKKRLNHLLVSAIARMNELVVSSGQGQRIRMHINPHLIRDLEQFACQYLLQLSLTMEQMSAPAAPGCE